MKEYESGRIRNVAFVGHQGSGKTTLVEALLHNTGAITRMGRIEDRNTVSDWEEDEHARGISLSTSLIPLEFNDTKINVLDTPGYTDFQGEVKNAIRVADSVVVVVDAVHGVEVGTQLAWSYAEVYQQSIIVTINKMDRENASFEGALESLRQNFPEYKFIPVMIPIGAQAGFKGVINLLTMRAYYGTGAERSDLPAELADEAQAAHVTLVEAAAEADDKLIEKYFSTGDLTNEEIRDGMRKAARDAYLKTVPVFVTSGATNTGTVPLMEALVVYVNPPTDRRYQVIRTTDGEPAFMTAPQSDDQPLAAYVFKTAGDRFVGTLNFFRIFSGQVTSETRAFNTVQNAEERFNTLMVMRGKEQIPVTRLHCGDIGVVAKMTHTTTGDTLVSGRDQAYTIVRPQFPDPLYKVALSPRTAADGAKIGQILTNLCAADPTLRWRQDPDVKQTVLEGMGETHIAVTLARAEKLGVGIDTIPPKVPYRETITAPASATYRHKKQTGGAGQFGEVTLNISPNPGGGITFTWDVFGGAISRSFEPSVHKGVLSLVEEGILAGFPVVDVAVSIADGKEHPVDSKDIAFQIAGREAFKEAFMAGKPALQEPIYTITVTVPEAMMGDILSDLNTRRARVQGMETVGTKSVVTATVPLAEVMRYGTDLRSITGGRGIYTLSFVGYETVPAHVAQNVIAAHKTG